MKTEGMKTMKVKRVKGRWIASANGHTGIGPTILTAIKALQDCHG